LGRTTVSAGHVWLEKIVATFPRVSETFPSL
jgi:hypothetical protein